MKLISLCKSAWGGASAYFILATWNKFDHISRVRYILEALSGLGIKHEIPLN